MIYIIVGASCAGKSSFVYNTFIKNKNYENVKDIFWLTKTNDCYIIGKYDTPNRRKGTDTINKRYLGQLKEQVERLVNENKDIVLEGTRCCSRPLFNHILSLNQKVKLIWIKCSIETSFKRANDITGNNGNPPNITQVKRDWATSKNIFYDYRYIFDSYIIDSDNVQDFSTFDISYLKENTMEEKKFRDDFAIFILSHGRATKQHTVKYLLDHNYKGKWYIILDNEDKQVNDYIRLYGKEHIYIFDKIKQSQNMNFDICDNFPERNVVVFARNMCFDIAKELGLKYFLEFDDDYNEFKMRYVKNGSLTALILNDFESIINELIDFMDNTPTTTIAMSQQGDWIGGKECAMYKDRLTRKAMNTFMCKVDRPFEFYGRINEDVNAYVVDGQRGKLFFTFADICMHQANTQQVKGGLTEAYLFYGTYVKSFYSVMVAPSCVSINDMGVGHRRIHHSISWENCCPKILNERYKKK